MNNNNLVFNPHWLVKNPHLQTIVASRKVTLKSDVIKKTKEVILKIPVDNGVRLQGFYTPQSQNLGKGLVLLVHGWWGHAESTYVLALADFLYRWGYSIFRLNLRDHGDSLHLNKGFFHGARLEELFQATRQIVDLEPSSPFYMVGFSIGGNFVLRLGERLKDDPICNLQHLIGLNPAVKPKHSLAAIDKSFYRSYFLRKWREKLREKEKLFPTRFDFSRALACKNLVAMGEAAIPQFSKFTNSIPYYQAYDVTPFKIKAINVPTTIIMAEDDPIVSIQDIKALEGLNPQINFAIQPHGGHIGFFDIYPFRRWLNEAIFTILEIKK